MDEKKKLAVVGALGVVILGVGAFQFMPGKSAPKPKPKAKVVAEKSTDTVAIQIPLDPPSLPPRDPFAVPEGTVAENPKAADPVNLGQPPTRPSEPRVMGTQNPAGESPSNFKRNVAMRQVQGEIGPLPVATPNFGGTAIAKAGAPGSEGTPGLPGAPSAKPEAEPTFDYHLVGVVLGAHPVAVMVDKTGSQHLVAEGAPIDGDAQLDSVNKGEVFVRFRGKRLRIVMGGVSVGK